LAGQQRLRCRKKRSPKTASNELAIPSPIVLVGDRAFQMTGVELSTAVRLGLRPIVLVLNNDGHGTMRKIREGAFNVITRWDYHKSAT